MSYEKYVPTIIALIIILGMTFAGFLVVNNNKKAEDATNLVEAFYITDFESDRRYFFEELKDTNWNDIIRLNNRYALEILQKLYSLQFQNDEEVVSVLSAYKGLDGTYAELYSAIISKLYLDDELGTVAILSQLSHENIQENIKYIKYGCDYENPNKVFEDTYKLLKSNNLTDLERNIITKIVN